MATPDTELSIHVADRPTARLVREATVRFTTRRCGEIHGRAGFWRTGEGVNT
jgi:hypothetical protein